MNIRMHINPHPAWENGFDYDIQDIDDGRSSTELSGETHLGDQEDNFNRAFEILKEEARKIMVREGVMTSNLPDPADPLTSMPTTVDPHDADAKEEPA